MRKIQFLKNGTKGKEEKQRYNYNNKTAFRTKNIHQNKRKAITNKGTIYEEDVIVINLYVSNI